MKHFALITLHLFAAITFVGTVFFEVLILEGIRKPVGRETMRAVELAIARRARRMMPFVMLVLYGAGISMAWQYRRFSRIPSLAASRCCSGSRSGWRSAFWRISSLR